MTRHNLFLFVLTFIFSLIVSACNPNNNLPTLMATGSSSSTKVTATVVTRPPQLAATNTTNKPTSSAITTATAPIISSTPQTDKSDEIDTLLDELNNALKSMDTLDDLK